MTLVLKQNDSYPPVEAILSDTEGAIDLSEAEEVRFVAKLTTGATTIEGVCTIEDAEKGIVVYAWEAKDTETVGVYEVEFKIVWSGALIESVPNEKYDAMEIQVSL